VEPIFHLVAMAKPVIIKKAPPEKSG